MRRTLERAARAWVAISIFVLFAFGIQRALEMGAGTDDPFGRRYVAHPVVAVVHFVPGLFYLAGAPLQFLPGVRRRYLHLHRRFGRMLVALALVSGVYALAAAFVLPAFGGVPTQAATVVFGLWFLLSLLLAVHHIRQGRVAKHRVWMIRAFAVALGVATIRAYVALLQIGTGGSMLQVFPAAFWLGLSTNALAGEVWIRSTRDAPA